MARYENGLSEGQIRHNNQSIRVIFRAPYLAEPDLMAGVRQNFGKSRILKKLAIIRTIQLFALFYQGALSLQLH